MFSFPLPVSYFNFYGLISNNFIALSGTCRRLVFGAESKFPEVEIIRFITTPTEAAHSEVRGSSFLTCHRYVYISFLLSY